MDIPPLLLIITVSFILIALIGPDKINSRQRYAINCIYGTDNLVPKIYPDDPTAAKTTINGHAVAGQWGNWTQIIPAATIDADSDLRYFDIHSISITGVTVNSILYFEVAYDDNGAGITSPFARGFIEDTGVGARSLVRNQDFKSEITLKITGNNVYMRINSDQAGESIDANPILWCDGNESNP